MQLNHTTRGDNGWANAAAVVVLIGFTTAAFWRSLRFYFLSDDFYLVKFANAFHFAVRPLFATTGGDGFFRPIGYVSLALTSMWAGVNPVAWHASALALHVANVILVFMLASRLCASWLAVFFAAALFAVHGTRPEAAVWIAGRFDLVTTFFVLAGILLFLRSYHQAASIGYVYTMGSLVCMVLAILSKESAYIFPLLLVLLLIARREQSCRIRVLIPFFVTAAALFVYRWRLFGGIGGYRDAHTGKAQTLAFGLATIKALGLRIWTVLYFPINWSTEPAAWLVAITLLYIGALIWLAANRRYRTEMIFPVGLILASAIPPLHLLGIGAGLGNSRLLYFPSVGFCLMLAVVIDRLEGRVRWIIPGVILAFHFGALQHNLNQWEYVSRKARAASAVAVDCIGPSAEKISVFGVPGTLRGVPFFANVLPENLELQRSNAAERLDPSKRTLSNTVLWDSVEDRLRCVEQR